MIGDSYGETMDQGLNFHIINSMRTGNMLFDMLIAMCIPILIRKLLDMDWMGYLKKINRLIAKFLNWLVGKREYILRCIQKRKK